MNEPAADISSRHIRWFKGLDSLRFILALIVVLSHFDDPLIRVFRHFDTAAGRVCAFLLENAFNGTAAVIAFFIISGFVIHYPNKNGLGSLGKFWMRRFVRILIPLVVIFLAGTRFGHPDKKVIWSLVCELVYYAIYPFLLKLRIKWLYQCLGACLLAVIAIGAGAQHDIQSLVQQKDIHYHSYYWQLGIGLTWLVGLPVWLLGVMVAEHIDEPAKVSMKEIMTWRAGVYAISCLLIIARSYWFVSYILSMTVFAPLICLWLKAEIIFYRDHQPAGFLEKMGKFSYSLYLCHPLAYVILRYWLKNSVVNYPVVMTLTIAIAYIFYLLVERPAHALALKISRNW
ncbi:acyltransferase family protein [Mucilaginibacter ginsenosidivorans]|uniref:Acyltransferase n=1 Tax=Mucilaginibacter ginsenosidivorans TaxID=398053 RepID=A0A5B8UUF7_9SPHI|nr:acyltransferase [Mucilaginibacter ginsenosidivorans]QEC62573.1 acyltransferase [Mucilaginibacter ginsenosidivorans]